MLRLLPLLVSVWCLSITVNVHSVEHRCVFDGLNDGATEVHIIQELPDPNSTTLTAYTAVAAASEEDGNEKWKFIRIRVSTEDLNDTKKHCTGNDPKEKRVRGFMNASLVCNKAVALTEEKKANIRTIIRSAIQMHATRLKVRPIRHGFKVPEMTSGFCSSLTIPDAHRETGVRDTDFLLYVSALGERARGVMAIAAPCAKLRSGRPVVGGISYSPMHASATPYSVRVAAHEMAHALGFSFELLASIPSVRAVDVRNVRNKSHVMEVRGVRTTLAAKKHFGCDTLSGMELEDEGFSGNVAAGSHWERRNARDELMAGIVNKGYYTALTLALFRDTGFYQPEMDTAEVMEWGANAGCDFLTTPCVTFGQSNFPSMFCTDFKQRSVCTMDEEKVGACSAINTYNGPLPRALQYFNNPRLAVGEETLTDRCPIVEYSDDTDCRISTSDEIPSRKGPHAWCLTKTATSKGSIGTTGHTSLCADVRLHEGTELRVVYGDNGQSAVCSNGTVTFGAPFDALELHCPSVERVSAGRRAYDAVLLGADKQADEDMEVRVYMKAASPSTTSNNTREDRAAVSEVSLVAMAFILYALCCY